MAMSIGDLARLSGLPTSTIRYYEEIGVLGRPERVNGRRVFDERAADRLLVVTSAQEAGFSLREIRQLFAGFSSETPAGVRWQALATSKLAELETLAARIEVMKSLLREHVRCGCVDLETCGRLLRAAQPPNPLRGRGAPAPKSVAALRRNPS